MAKGADGGEEGEDDDEDEVNGEGSQFCVSARTKPIT